jgi:hypothetical protein
LALSIGVMPRSREWFIVAIDSPSSTSPYRPGEMPIVPRPETLRPFSPSLLYEEIMEKGRFGELNPSIPKETAF